MSCTGVYSGGDGGPCVQLVRTPANEDPTGVRPGGIQAPPHRSFVLVAATNNTICTDLSTQVPGGVWARIRQPTANGAIAQGRPVLVKCQTAWNGALWDYVAEYKTTLPATKAAGWIDDALVPTGVTTDLPNVPRCWGVSVNPAG